MYSGSLDRVRKAIGFRLALGYSTFFIVTSVLLFGLAHILLTKSLVQYDRHSLHMEVAELAHHYHTNGLEGVKRAVAALTPESFFVRVADARNVTAWIEHPAQWAMFDLGQLTRGEIAGFGSVIHVPEKDQAGKDVLEIVSQRLSDGALLQVGKSTASRRAALDRSAKIAGGVMIPVVLLGILGGAFLAARALKPIRQLIHTVRAIESGAMEVRVPTRGTGDELDELGTLFNRMLNKIAILISGMRGALDSVAHDLRTPMARLRGIAEIALRSEQRQEAYREALADCLEESDQVLVMLNTLMDISEAETGTLKLNLEVTNISSVIENTVQLYQHVAEEKSIAVSTSGPKGIWLTADRNRMQQVLANLLDNAIKYTAPDGRINIKVYKEQDAGVIDIEDSGIGMAPDELPKIWGRLYRADPSRSQRGLGLGLSLVKAVVQAHGGHVEVSSTVGIGSVFTIRLPGALADGWSKGP